MTCATLANNMNLSVDKNHQLTGDPKVVQVPYARSQSEMPIRRGAIVHFTAGATAMSSINFWKTPEARGAEAHLCIDRDGTIYQILPFNKTADHAGPQSDWIDHNDGKKYVNLNKCFIGIELANAGNSPKVIEWAKKNAKAKGVFLSHRQTPDKREEWEVYPAAQIDSLMHVLRAIKERYNLDIFLGHDEVAYNDRRQYVRKNDPGPAISMEFIRSSFGMQPKYIPGIRN